MARTLLENMDNKLQAAIEAGNFPAAYEANAKQIVSAISYHVTWSNHT